jgi:hypothetical protein
MSEIGYIVKVNGLFNIPEKKSKPLGKGLMEQITEGNHIPYESLTTERLGQIVRDVFTERPLPTIVGGTAAHEMFNQAFRDQLITGESSFRINLDSEGFPIVTTGTTLIGGVDPYDSDGTVTISYMDAPERDNGTSTVDRRRLVINTLQRQLQQGEISAMEYLDLISQQE